MKDLILKFAVEAPHGFPWIREKISIPKEDLNLILGELKLGTLEDRRRAGWEINYSLFKNVMDCSSQEELLDKITSDLKGKAYGDRGIVRGIINRKRFMDSKEINVFKGFIKGTLTEFEIQKNKQNIIMWLFEIVAFNSAIQGMAIVRNGNYHQVRKILDKSFPRLEVSEDNIFEVEKKIGLRNYSTLELLIRTFKGRKNVYKPLLEGLLDKKEATIEKNQKIEEMQKIQEIQEIQEIQDIQEIQEIQDIQESQEIQEVKKIQDIQDIQDTEDIEATQVTLPIGAFDEENSSKEPLSNALEDSFEDSLFSILNSTSENEAEVEVKEKRFRAREIDFKAKLKREERARERKEALKDNPHKREVAEKDGKLDNKIVAERDGNSDHKAVAEREDKLDLKAGAKTERQFHKEPREIKLLKTLVSYNKGAVLSELFNAYRDIENVSKDNLEAILGNFFTSLKLQGFDVEEDRAIGEVVTVNTKDILKEFVMTEAVDLNGEFQGRVQYLPWSYKGQEIMPMVIKPLK